ncbi:MAG: hypothetical protein C3F07_17440 [Anaerolineales bacterium]|nr:hypothetical protein [Anaerolineae bacterium]PWB70230.1 MAG: hypothetical protein C3F07_17440 [Anaerolineales bacterium]
MLSPSDLIHLPYTRDLTEGGIAYALRSLPYTYNRMGGSQYDRLRRIVAGVAVELAFRRYLAEQNVPFDVKGATPFTDPDRYDVALGGRRCDIKSFLITYREQISEMKRNPAIVLNAPALVPSDQNAAEGHAEKNIYLFAFLSGIIAASQADLQKAIHKKQPHYLVHAMPNPWMRPSEWTPLGALALKSESEAGQFVEIGGQDAGREMRSLEVELPPRRRVQITDEFHSLVYIHSKSLPDARIGIHSPARRETHLIGALDWGNIWIYGMDILLAGWLTREEFNRQANSIQEGSRVFQYDRTRTKNLAVPVSELRPIADLLTHVKEWNQ